MEVHKRVNVSMFSGGPDVDEIINLMNKKKLQSPTSILGSGTGWSSEKFRPWETPLEDLAERIVDMVSTACEIVVWFNRMHYGDKISLHNHLPSDDRPSPLLCGVYYPISGRGNLNIYDTKCGGYVSVPPDQNLLVTFPPQFNHEVEARGPRLSVAFNAYPLGFNRR